MEDYVKLILENIKAISGASKHKKSDSFFGEDCKELTLAQLDLMAYLYEHKREKMSSLAKYAGVTMPSMTETVNKLVSMGVVEREHDENDRRTVWVHVTKDVEKMVCGHINKKHESLSGLMDVLTLKEKQQALSILQKIRKQIEREQKQ
jgi:DNA-binding MarR family transcriptional regulator